MENQQHVQELSSEKTEFKREIGVFGGVSIIGGIMIGSGIFYLGSYVLQRTNYNMGLALLAWILGGVISLFAGLCYAKLGAAMPKAGGRTVYLTEAYHPCVGFLAGFCDWLIGGPGSVAALAIALPTALKPVMGISDAGIQVATHVIGDGAVEKTIDSYEKTFGKEGNKLRHTLVHCQITDRALLERIAKLGIVVSYQPIFLDYDMHIVEKRCGKELASTSYAFKTLGDLGAKIAYGTDCPVEDCNPFPNIYSAVTRKDSKGFPEGGFYPEECVDVYTAVDAYTEGSAYMEFMEGKKGRIKPGQLADIVVLDKDIFTCDPMEIKDILPVMTMVDGKIVYKK
ncbi:amino acid permease [Intestinibacter sp.]|uniref:amino acid permease n=1 Tax=Intestinibacter sp. TaxID=1965304 RepID=UPI002A9086CC|nr:amino acid permease [Intestinibacter sp.]MDY5211727.1 amino acid permease [Intestinibacter sp.]